METFELRYFLVAAELESINKAADRLAVSSPAISRAISRLEDELGIKLFERSGRNIVLSLYGKQFQKEVSQIIGSIDDLKTKFKPTDFHIGISLIGTEFGLSSFICEIVKKVTLKKIQFSLDLKMAATSKHVERAIGDGEAQLGIVTRPPHVSFKKIRLGQYQSKIYVGEDHPIYKFAKKGQAIEIQDILKHDFASFFESVFTGAEDINQSTDGWRDDKFKRRITLRSDSVEAVLRLVEAGRFLCYLPTSIAKGRTLLPVETIGCPYKCETEVYLIADKQSNYGWMSSIF